METFELTSKKKNPDPPLSLMALRAIERPAPHARRHRGASAVSADGRLAEVVVVVFAFLGAGAAAIGVYGAAIGRVDVATAGGFAREAARQVVSETGKIHERVAGIDRAALLHSIAPLLPSRFFKTPAPTEKPAPENPVALVPSPMMAPEAELPAVKPVWSSTFDRAQVLSDAENRIGADFRIPAGLQARAAFWFDVYSKWDSDKRIIHDARRPWIVYQVVDVAPILYADVPRRRWLRNLKADQVVKVELARVRAALGKLAKNRPWGALTLEERALVAPLQSLGGDLASAAKAAMGQVRIQTGQRDFFMSGLVASPRYLGTMEKIFEAYHLPKELTRLPFVESSFNKAATSKVGASGIWQLMGGTGSKFLIVAAQIDERRSPYKATDAAARLLQENHLILHRSWPLAVTAWNHGPGGVRKAMAKAGSRDLATILERYHTKNFDFASSNFYCEFLGALHAEAYKDVVFGPLDTEPALDSLFIALPHAFHARELMRLTGLSRDEFSRLNPDLDRAVERDAAIPRAYRLHIPSSLRASAEAALSGGAPRGKS